MEIMTTHPLHHQCCLTPHLKCKVLIESDGDDYDDDDDYDNDDEADKDDDCDDSCPAVSMIIM